MTYLNEFPEFSNPPLNEVVLGVQFAPIPAYTSVYAKDIWELFKNEFPAVSEQSALDSRFEIFGGANVQTGQKIHIGGRSARSRLWFESRDRNHLLQFQPDRFIANWRKQQDSNGYPRYEGIAKAFEKNLNKLGKYLTSASNLNYQIDINQAEIAYVNVIHVEDFSEIGEWFRFWSGEALNTEMMNMSFSEVIQDRSGEPFARLNQQIQSVFATNGKNKALRLTISFQGIPSGNDITSAMKFVAEGREAIVRRFCEITTEKAHKIWGGQV